MKWDECHTHCANPPYYGSDLLMKWDECRYPPHRHAADPDHTKFCAQMAGVEAELLRCVGPHTT